MAFYERGEDGKIMLATEVPEEAIRLIESMDDKAVIQRMTSGIAGDVFIYRYSIKTKTGTKEIIGISTDGAYELANTHIRNIETLSDVRLDKDSDPDYIYAMVRVRSHSTNVTLLGVGRQCKFMMDSGNVPIRGRINEHAFVAAISKAQRNGILHHADQEVIVEIIDSWSKTGKSRQLKPPSLDVEPEKPNAPVATPPPTIPTTTGTPPPTVAPTTSAPTITPDQITAQQERLKNLRMDVHARFEKDLGIGVDKRKVMLKEKFSVDSLLDLNEQQLKDCLAWIEELIREKSKAPPVAKPPAENGKTARVTALGFESETEQNTLRGRLYHMLTDQNQLGLNDEEAKELITNKDYGSTSEISREALLEIIKEVDSLIKAKQSPAPELPLEEPPI